jgi:phosphate transport system substrate-binding protein
MINETHGPLAGPVSGERRMDERRMDSRASFWTAAAMLACGLLASVTGCGQRQGAGSGSSPGGSVVIRVEGSDTMVNLAQAWAEEYSKLHPKVSVQVSGGGSGVGVASLTEQTTDLASVSREMKDKEVQRAEQNTGKKPKQFVVALDALAVYVHKANPLDTISLPDLAEIYGENGTITKWSQLGVQNVGCKSDEITRVSRQNNSGTYHYFREEVLGANREFKLGSIDQSGSKDLVALVSSTPCAIGYSGMGYHTADAKWLKVAKQKGQVGIEPSVASAKDKTYPLARPLYLYSLGEPSGPVREYLDWILSEAGQKIVIELGYVPVGEVPPAAGGQASAGGSTPDTKAKPAEPAAADAPAQGPKPETAKE